MLKVQKYSLIGFYVLLIFIGLWPISFAHTSQEETVTASTTWQHGYTLILMSNTDIASANQARDYVISQGGRIAILSPPHIMFGWVSPELSTELIGKYGIEYITQSPVDLNKLKYQDDQTLALASFFNSVSSGSLVQEMAASMAVKGEPLINDALEHPIINYNNYLKNLQNLGVAPSLGNSDSMTGTVAVNLFFVESNGSIDSDTYTWNSTDQQNTINRAASGLSWWASQAPSYGASVTFTTYYYSSTSSVSQQGYEPILHSSTDDYLWINQIMTNLGYTSGNSFDRVIAFNTWLKEWAGTNWAYSVFIGYNPSPASDRFTDGYFAYAYFGGPYSQMLFRNNGWGEGNFGLVLAHETGHIFWACDEYYEAGYGGCTSCGPCASSGPRPTINNENCEYCNPNAVACMMRDNSYALCSFTPLQIGWQGAPSCPSLYFWDGNEYVRRGFILPGAMPRENEYRDHIPLNRLELKDGMYVLQIRETEPERSFIDMVRLVVVDHSYDSRTNPVRIFKEPIAPRPTHMSEVLYKSKSYVASGSNIAELSPSSAIHSRVGNVLPQLINSDDSYVKMHPGDIITLQFPYIPMHDEKRDFIFVGEGFYVPLK